MLVNPRSALAKVSGINQFSAPIPGQSLTDEPGSRAWEKPPKYTDVNDAFRHIANSLSDNPDVMGSFEKLMASGVSIQEITRTITFGGFAAGLWSVDVAELLQPPVGALLVLHAKESDIPFKMFVHEGRSVVEGQDGITDEIMLKSMQEKNPEGLQQLIAKNAQQLEYVEQKMTGMEPSPEMEGFLTVSNEEEI